MRNIEIMKAAVFHLIWKLEGLLRNVDHGAGWIYGMLRTFLIGQEGADRSLLPTIPTCICYTQRKQSMTFGDTLNSWLTQEPAGSSS